MHNRKRWVGAALVLLFLLLVGLLMWPRVAAEPLTAEVAGAPVRSEPAPPTPPKKEAPTPEAPALSPQAKAVTQLAELHGYGWVQCLFPDDTLSGQRLDGPLQYQHWDGRVLTGATLEAEVEMAVWTLEQVDDTGLDIDTLPPAIVLHWTGAHPGEHGRCTVSAPAQVTVRGRLVWPDGRPVAKQAVEACDEDLVTDADGRFEAHAWGGDSCFYEVDGYALVVGDQAPDTYPVVDVGLDDVDVELVVVDEDLEKDLTAEEKVLLAESFDPKGVHPLEQLLASPDLDPAARPQVEAWNAEMQANREQMQEIVDGLRTPPVTTD